jgi:hypothetical protein
MIATAEAFNNGGFAAPGPNATFVYLNHSSGSQKRILILAFSEGQTESDGMKVGMVWLTPTHLQLKYKGQHTLDFQAIKCAGIDISVQELTAASQPMSSSRSLQ